MNTAIPTLLNHPHADEARGAEEMDPRNRWIPGKPYIPQLPPAPCSPFIEETQLFACARWRFERSLLSAAQLQGQGPPASRASSQVLQHRLPQGKVIAFRSIILDTSNILFYDMLFSLGIISYTSFWVAIYWFISFLLMVAQYSINYTNYSISPLLFRLFLAFVYPK